MSRNSLRLATWNIASNRNYDAVAAKLAELDIDVCALQEVALDPAVGLPVLFGHGPGDASGYCWYFSSALMPAEVYDGTGQYFGLAIASRIPLSRSATFQLGPPGTGSVVHVENEPRILQVAAVPLQRPLFVGNTHLATAGDWELSAMRRSQADKIAGMLRPLAAQGPVILCGDFNAGPSSSDLVAIRQALPNFYSSNRGTFADEVGRPPIDFFCSSVALDVNISVFPPDGLSDHSIVVAAIDGLGSGA